MTMVPSAPRSSALKTTVCGGNGQSCGNASPYGVPAGFASAWQVRQVGGRGEALLGLLSPSPPSLEPPQPASVLASSAVAASAVATVRGGRVTG